MGQPVAFLEVISRDHERAHPRFCGGSARAGRQVREVSSYLLRERRSWQMTRPGWSRFPQLGHRFLGMR